MFTAGSAWPLQVEKNPEIGNIVKILGLQYKEKYTNPESLRKLRYGKLMIMTDQVEITPAHCIQTYKYSQ